MASHVGGRHQPIVGHQNIGTPEAGQPPPSFPRHNPVIPAQAGTHGPDSLPSHNRKTHQPVRLTKTGVAPEIGQPPRLSGEGRNPENLCERAPPLNEEGRHFIAPYAPGNR